MSERKQYWGQIGISGNGCMMEARAVFAGQLLSQFSVIAGAPQGEDTAGRSIVVLQPPTELVERAFAIADAYFDAAELRGEVRSAPTAQEIVAAEGDLLRLKMDREYGRTKEPKGA